MQTLAESAAGLVVTSFEALSLFTMAWSGLSPGVTEAFPDCPGRSPTAGPFVVPLETWHPLVRPPVPTACHLDSTVLLSTPSVTNSTAPTPTSLASSATSTPEAPICRAECRTLTPSSSQQLRRSRTASRPKATAGCPAGTLRILDRSGVGLVPLRGSRFSFSSSQRSCTT